jgi:hypothetical protein
MLHKVISKALRKAKSLEAAKLAFADSYVVLIADTSDLDNFYAESSCKLKSLSAGQPFSGIGLLSAAG